MFYDLKKIPKTFGVYQFFDENGVIIYVGKSNNLQRRVSSYFLRKNHNAKTNALVKNIRDIKYIVTQNDEEAFLLEGTLIKKLQPKYNIIFKDGKTYPYIVINNESIPRLYLYRGAQNKNEKYFGPFPYSGVAKEAIRILQKFLQIRPCTKTIFDQHRKKGRPCLLFALKKCGGYCCYDDETYPEKIKAAEEFLRGKPEKILALIKNEMLKAAQKQNFEKAAILRDQITDLTQFKNQQFVSLNRKRDIDVLFVISKNDLFYLNQLFVRDGLVIDSLNFKKEDNKEQSKKEVLEEFIFQNYINLPDNFSVSSSDFQQISDKIDAEEENLLPKVIITSEKINSELFKNITNIKISSPQKKEEHEFIKLAQKNLLKYIEEDEYNSLIYQKMFAELNQQLNLDVKRIECFDISHSFGEATIASCITISENGPEKKEYRYYKIEEITPGSDPEALQKAAVMRYSKHEITTDLLLLIDGGITQIRAIKNALLNLGHRNFNLYSIFKGEKRNPKFDTILKTDALAGKEEIVNLNHDSLGFRVLQIARNEAHRFAIKNHRKALIRKITKPES